MKKYKKTLDERFAGKPDWYWVNGLHDADILEVHELELPPDWKAQKPRWNCLEMVINAKGALFDTSVRKICLYNYKVLSGNISDFDEKNIWWYTDTLTCNENDYLLDITLEKSNGDKFSLKIKFEAAEVERK